MQFQVIIPPKHKATILPALGQSVSYHVQYFPLGSGDPKLDILREKVNIISNEDDRDVWLGIEADHTRTGYDTLGQIELNEMIHGVGTVQFAWTMEKHSFASAIVIVSKM